MSKARPAVGTEQFCVIAIDDQRDILTSLASLLRRRGFALEGFTSPREALARFERDPSKTDLLLVDVDMPEMSGLEVIERARRIDPDVPVLMLSGDATARTAVTALKLGAFDYLVKPPEDAEEMALRLSRAAAHGLLLRRARRLEQNLLVAQRFDTLVGNTRQMRDLFATIQKVAQSDVGVLILGESGTGKELVARAIHERSGRSRQPFVAFNCGAVPEALVDSELFGHLKGAFTGASTARPGVFREADRGTLFLDEVGTIPVAAQIRLLRALQEGEIRPVGGTGSRKVDVRVLAATNADLQAAVKAGTFREDLFYRLNVVMIRLPPLRDRVADVPLLAAHFIEKHTPRGRAVPAISQRALEALTAYSWPGNVRELENAMLRGMALTHGDVIDINALPPAVRDAPVPEIAEEAAGEAAEPLFDGLSYQQARKRAQETFERRFVTNLLNRTRGNISEAARLAGLDRSNFRRILTRNEIDAGAFGE